MTALNEATELPLNLSGGEPVVDYIPPGAQLGAGVHRGVPAISKPLHDYTQDLAGIQAPVLLIRTVAAIIPSGAVMGRPCRSAAHDLAVGERGGFPEVGRAQDCASDEALAPKADDLNRFGIDSLIP